jgi:hypothetical protein
MSQVSRITVLLVSVCTAIGLCSGGVLKAASQKSQDVDPVIVILPTDVVLTGQHARQRLIVEAVVDKQFVADWTERATFRSADEQVAVVDQSGMITPVADGHTRITAQIDQLQTSISIEVRNMKKPSRWNFRNHVLSVLTKMDCNSGACHGAAAGKRNFRLTLRGYDPQSDYETLTREVLGRRVVKTRPSHSLVLLKPTGAVSHGGGKRFSTDSLEYRVISEWIASGTSGPSENDSLIESIEVFPKQALMKVKETQQLSVQARFSDGHIEDVTRWCKFETADANIASVTPQGAVTLQGYGEGVVTVWYLNLVDVARVTSPFPNTIPVEVFQHAENFNFIDRYALQKLESLQIPPSPLCSDSQFIRRAFLDAIGILPTVQETTNFLKDRSLEKRRALIDMLLARPEFIDYWSYKWSDLLLVSSRRLPDEAMWSFYTWVRRSVASNQPWDEFAHDLVTARGNTLNNGASNFFVLHKDPKDLIENTSVALMGMSITCARCHNHPLEKWTQDDYYGMVSLFSRVKMKNGDAAGDVTVFLSDQGEVPHPRHGRPLNPQPLDGSPIAMEGTGDRREFFSQWLTDSENPYFSRALVNRVWANFMGRGLVESVDDLRVTNPASNEALFAGLAEAFVDSGFNVRQLIRTVMNSATYQRSSETVSGNEDDQKYYSHYILKRLSAEVLLDCFSQVTGVPTVFANYPRGWRALQLPDSSIDSYFLDSFGRPLRETTCECERSEDPSLSQALHLSNGPTLNNKLRAKGAIDRMLEKGLAEESVLEELFLAALSRYPSDREKEAILVTLHEFTPAEVSQPEDEKKQRRQLYEDLFWAILTGREFLFNH